MQIVLVRHGQTEWNKEGRFQGTTDIPLNDIGRLEARKAASFLKEQQWDCIISSPLLRARQTATIISEGIDSNTLVMDELIEQCFGDAEGLFYHELEEKYEVKENIPGYETREQVSKRIAVAMDKIAQLNYKKVIVVTHGVAINEFLCLVEFGYSNGHYYTLNNCGVSEVFLEEGQWRIASVNDKNHLLIEVI